MLHDGTRPESYSVFKTGLPLTKRGPTVVSFQYYRVSSPDISHAIKLKARIGEREN